MKRKIILLAMSLVLATAGIAAWAVYSSNKKVVELPSDSQNSQQTNDETPKSIRIVAVGDVLPHDSVNQAAKTGDSYDYAPLFSEVSQYLDAGDITYCNQESPSAGTALGISGYPTFNAPTEFSRDLQKVGCNVINLANNHIADKGEAGITGTLDTWQRLSPLAFSGANRSQQEQAQPKYFEVDGVKFAFIAFTDSSNSNNKAAHSVNMFSKELVEQLAKEADKNADYVIASAHWGVENSDKISQIQRDWAKLMAENGVDLVLGEGPHVLQPVEVLKTTSGKEVPIWYSLGNLLSSQLKIEELIGGMAVLDFDISSGDMKLSKMSFLPTYMHYEWTAAQAAAEDLLTRKNLKLYPLDKASEPLGRSLFATSVEQQTERVRTVLNSAGTKITIITPEEF